MKLELASLYSVAQYLDVPHVYIGYLFTHNFLTNSDDLDTDVLDTFRRTLSWKLLQNRGSRPNSKKQSENAYKKAGFDLVEIMAQENMRQAGIPEWFFPFVLADLRYVNRKATANRLGATYFREKDFEELMKKLIPELKKLGVTE